MPTNSSSPKKPRKSRVRRLGPFRLIGLLLLFSLCLLAAVATYFLRHLDDLAKRAIERALPGVRAEIESASIVLPNQLQIRSLTLLSRRDGETLLTLNGGDIAIDFSGLRQRRIHEIRLVEPVIHISPEFAEAAFSPPSPVGDPGPANPAGSAGQPWSVDHFVCDYGEIRVSRFGPKDLLLQTKFAFDFENFSPTSAPQAEHALVFWDFSATKNSSEAFFNLDVVDVTFRFEGLLEKKSITSLSLQGGSLLVGDALREIFANPEAADPAPPPSPDPSSSTGDIPWMVETLDIERVTVRIEDERPEVTDITFAINTTLQKLPLSKTASALGAEEQIIEITNLDILSPYDPLTKVITIEHIYFHFSLAGLVQQRIADLTISAPTIHISQDLFWYMEDIQRRLGLSDTEKPDPTSTSSSWAIDRLWVVDGQAVLGSSGRRQYGIPLGFYTKAQDVALDNLAALKLEAALEIPPEKYSFESYQLEFTSEQGGTLRFSYPPEKEEKNLVGDISLSEIRWRQYQASEAFVSVTFSEEGINGSFGGTLYHGLAGGGFSFFFDTDAPWIGWLYGNEIDLRRLTDIASPKNFQMTGPLTFKLQMNAHGKAIERVLGEMEIPESGQFRITKLDAFLADIPPTWSLLKQSGTRIALEALRDFSYDSGTGDFWFVRSQGIFQLKLQGPDGSRSFDIVLHADDSSEGQWKKIPKKP